MTPPFSRTSPSVRRASRALLLTLAAVAGCAGSDVQPTGSLVDGSVSVSPRTAAIFVRENVQLNAATQVAGASVQWRSLTTDVADVSASGLVTATDRAGVARIVASSNGGADTATITVKERATRVAQVVVAGPVAGAQLLAVGSTAQLNATVRDEAGQTVTDRTVSWASANTAVATISTTGALFAVAPGSTSITATAEGVSGAVAVTVTASSIATLTVQLSAPALKVGQTAQATAVALDPQGQPVTGRPVAWTSSNPAVLTVSANGALQAVGAGTASITATVDGVTATANVSVTSAIARVTVAPATMTLKPGDLQRYSAAAFDAGGQLVTGQSVSWSSGNTAVATIDASGLVTARTVGSAVMTATIDGVTGTGAVVVNSTGGNTTAPVATVSVSLAASTVQIGQSTQATASAFDADGTALTGRAVTWASSNPAVATVNASGVVSAVSAGTVTITATSEGRSGSATLTVQTIPAVPVATVGVTLGASAVNVGATTQATAVARDASGNALTGRTIDWSSSNTAVATVNASGVVTGVTAGTANIRATVDGVVGSTAVTVNTVVVPVATVTVSLAASSVNAGATTQATATARDAGGNVLTGRTVTWSSTNAAVATVNASGVVTGVAAGTASIRATVSGIVGSANVTINAVVVPVATVSVSLTSASLTVGSATSAAAVARDASGNVLTGRTVSWSSANTTVATVAADGMVSAVAAGSAAIRATVDGIVGSSTLTVTTSSGGGSTPPQGAGEPAYNSTTDKLLVSDGFDSYTSIEGGSNPFTARYPSNRALGPNDNLIPLSSVVSLVPGRLGNAIRLSYGGQNASDIVVGTENRLNSVGSWNGTLPERAGPYTHFFFTTWFRFNAGADPASFNGSGVKGFMFWASSGRYQNAINQLSADGRTRGVKGANPCNAQSGLPLYKTADGCAPLIGTIADGQWHRFTIEIYAGNDPSGRRGERYWIDGNPIYDDVGQPVGSGTRTGHYDYASPITHWMVFGNFVSGAAGAGSTPFTFDVDSWSAWTN